MWIMWRTSCTGAHFSRAPWCLFLLQENPELWGCTDCCISMCWVKAVGWKHDSHVLVLFIHLNRALQMMTHYVGIVLSVCAGTEQRFFGIPPGISVWALPGLGAGGEGWGAAWHCRVRKQSCGDGKCPVCHQIPHLLAKLLQFCFLNMHRDLLVHKEKRQS